MEQEFQKPIYLYGNGKSIKTLVLSSMMNVSLRLAY